MSTPGLLLAAGAGRRFGSPKALALWAGEPLVSRGVRLLRDGGCDPVLVVVGAAAVEVAELAEAAGAVPVVADGWEQGMGTSLRAGLAALSRTAAVAVVVSLVDQPLLGPEAVARLRASSPGSGAAVATYEGRPGHPVLLDRPVWPEVADLAAGDEGARAWLRRFPGRVRPVPCDGTGRPADVDTPADLVRLGAAHALPGRG